MSNRALLFVAYVLLVSITAWSTWQIDRSLNRIEEDTCATSEIVLFSELSTVAIFSDQEDVNTETLRETLDTYLRVLEAIEDRCGRIFLDELNELKGG